MEIVTRPERGLFPPPREIELACSCPDWADLCKHVAASLYGVGARLDQKPELLFLLRGVNAAGLISRASAAEAVRQSTPSDAAPVMRESELADVFGIDLAPPSATPSAIQVNGQHRVAAPVEIDTADQGGVQSSVPKPRVKRRATIPQRFSAAARARIAAAARARWAKFKDQKNKRKQPTTPLQRKMSVAAKSALSSAMTAR